MDSRTLMEQQWPHLLSFLALDVDELEETARRWRAIRRKRRVDSAISLLRLALDYGFCGLSLRQTAAWAEACEVASLSDVALMKRLQGASEWLGHLLCTKLAERASVKPCHGLRLRLVDTSTVNAPGNSGTDWRLHMGLDLATCVIDDVRLTSARRGETLVRFPVRPDDVVVADRGYSKRKGLASIVKRQAHFIVRLNWANAPLQERNGDHFDLFAALRSVPEGVEGDFAVRLKPDSREKIPAVPVRLVTVRKSELAAAQARKTVIHRASKQSRTVDPRALEAASYVIVLTSLDPAVLPGKDVLETYRFRWQIELAFKRLKSLLDLDGLPAKDPALARTFIYSKLLAALLLDDLTQAFVSFSPWGFNLQRSHAFDLADPASPYLEHVHRDPRDRPDPETV